MTAQFGTVVSNVALVDVVASARQLAGEGLSVPDGLDMLVGETRHLGTDVPIRRGDLDLSGQANVSVTAPNVLRYDPRSRSLTALAPGTADVTIAVGGAAASVPVRVHAAPALDAATTSAVIEPSGDVLGVGESRDLRVYLVGRSGERLDRTGSALFSASGAAIGLTGSTVRGLAPGTGEVVARVPGVNEPARATFTVRDEALTALAVSPNPARLAVGEHVQLQVSGVGSNRRIDLGAAPS